MFIFSVRRCPKPPQVVRDRISDALAAIDNELADVYAQGQLWIEGPSNFASRYDYQREKMRAAEAAIERLYPPYRQRKR